MVGGHVGDGGGMVFMWVMVFIWVMVGHGVVWVIVISAITR